MSIALAAVLTGCLDSGTEDTTDAFETTAGTTDGGTLPGTSTGPGPDCVNVVSDPGFEAGNPNPSWTARSEVFSSPLCDASCSTEAAALPNSGAWWVWFGGAAMPDAPSVSQSLRFPSGVAELRYFLAVWPGDAEGDDQLTLTIDGTTIETILDDAPDASTDYEEIVVDVSAYADGQVHELTFSAQTSGVGNSGFFLDDVSLLDCSGIAGTGTDSSTSGDTTTSTGEDTVGPTASSGTESEGSVGTESTTGDSGSTTEDSTESTSTSTSTSTTTSEEESSSTGVAEESTSEGASSTGGTDEESSSSGAAE